jgi:exodeoxyribonuclease-3
VKLATWNVNSLNARLPRVLEFLAKHSPDVLCMQETKTTFDSFPRDALLEAGYDAVDQSAGQWAGVAIAVRQGLRIAEVERALPDNPLPDDARWIEATVEGVRVVSVYVVNGRSVDDPMFAMKMAFLEAMRERCARLGGTDVVVAGDFNIAPSDLDVYDPAAFENATHVTPDERARLQAILDGGFVDAYRHLYPEAVQHTWWDYRQGHFHRGMGLRIDLALVSTSLAPRLVGCGIDRDFRKGPKPSDHAPLLVEWREG